MIPSTLFFFFFIKIALAMAMWGLSCFHINDDSVYFMGQEDGSVGKILAVEV